MQSTEQMKCTACGAVVNPNWKACFVCDHTLNNYKQLDPEDVESLLTILKMTLSDFKKAGLLIRIKSHVLDGEIVYLASSEKEAETGKAEGLVCYTADEMLHLIRAKATPAEIQAVHMAKKGLGGVLTDVMEVKELTKVRGGGRNGR